MNQHHFDINEYLPKPIVTTRFAPSPTGLLHLGSAYSALFSEKTARDADGKFLLRIEDIDHTRCTTEFAEQILQDLEWLGIEWEGDVWKQSTRMDIYQEFVHTLEEADLVYPCFCTRKDIAEALSRSEADLSSSNTLGPDGPIYPGTCKHLDWRQARQRVADGEPHALRLHMDKAESITGPLTFEDLSQKVVNVLGSSCGDVVIARKELGTSYHLSVTIDDAFQGITHITRGMDLFSATAIHRILQTLFSLPEPKYHHHRLLSDETGSRLAKSKQSPSIAALRESGKTKEQVRSMLGFQ